MPNIALMKLSTYHKELGHNVEWYYPLFNLKYDKIYASSIFTFSEKNYVNDKMKVGGPPCQGFSISASNRRDPKDRRNFLYKEFANFGWFLQLAILFPFLAFRKPSEASQKALSLASQMVLPLAFSIRINYFPRKTKENI